MTDRKFKPRAGREPRCFGLRLSLFTALLLLSSPSAAVVRIICCKGSRRFRTAPGRDLGSAEK